MEAEIGFSAQVKIPFGEDPILGVFCLLIEDDLNSSEKSVEYQKLLIRSYLYLLKADVAKVDLANEILRFKSEREFYGLFQSYFNFLYRLGVRNSNFENNLSYLKSLIGSKGSSSSDIYKIIKDQKESSYSMEFEFGENTSLVKIMSAHASKGLQFDNVILGGIFTNDRSLPMTSFVGKMPFSFKWVDSIYGKNKFKTPHYIWEEILTKNKEFSENKRLFYVACTRAENGLYWVDINWGDNKRTSVGANSWSSALSKWCDDQTLIDIKQTAFDVSELYEESFLQYLENRPPLFHIDTLGTKIVKSSSQLSMLGEISVTKLASITGCPRMFYFENICKISEEEINFIAKDSHAAPSSEFDEEELSSKSFDSNRLVSSAQRGSDIHLYLSDQIVSNFEIQDDRFPALNPVVEKLKSVGDKFRLVSEKQIKFELFGYMISGIPDLILQPLSEDEPFEIWDFKTGGYSESKITPYYFQLVTYAYAQFKELGKSADIKCKLVIYFVDENRIVDYSVSREDVEKYLMDQIQKISAPQIKNLELCTQCKFNVICDK